MGILPMLLHHSVALLCRTGPPLTGGTPVPRSWSKKGSRRINSTNLFNLANGNRLKPELHTFLRFDGVIAGLIELENFRAFVFEFVATDF